MFSGNEWAILFVATVALILPLAIIALLLVSNRRRNGSMKLRDEGPGSVTPPPAWHADPSGRNELRYWAGGWTEHVSNGGITGVDSADR